MAVSIDSFDRFYIELLKQRCAKWGFSVELDESHLEKRGELTWEELDPVMNKEHTKNEF